MKSYMKLSNSHEIKHEIFFFFFLQLLQYPDEEILILSVSEQDIAF